MPGLMWTMSMMLLLMSYVTCVKKKFELEENASNTKLGTSTSLASEQSDRFGNCEEFNILKHISFFGNLKL